MAKHILKNIIILLILQYFIINIAFALESNSSNFVINSYFGTGATTNNLTNYAVDLGIGQIIISNSSDTNYAISEGIFYITNQTPVAPVAPPSCDNAHLSLCLTENTCSVAGGYWYSNSCHSNAQGGGGGGGGSSIIYPKYLIYPTKFFETVNKDAVLETEFYIDNLEISSPLRIELTSDLQIVGSKVFDVAPMKRATIKFIIDGLNKEGYYNDSISVRVQKNPTSYKNSNIVVDYFVKAPTQYINQTTNRTNSSYFDLYPFPFTGNNTKLNENIGASLEAADTFFSHPLFLIVALSLLIISAVIIHQSTKDKELTEKITETRSPLAYIVGGIIILGFGGLIWWLSTKKYILSMINSWYTHPAFFIVVLSLLVILVIFVLQSKKEGSNTLKRGKIALIIISIGLFFLVFKNSKVLNRFLYHLPDITKNWWFYVIVLSILIIIITIIVQLRNKANGDGGNK